MSTAITFYFNDIFKNYSEWKNFIMQTEIVDYNVATEEAFDKFCYNILSRHFSHSNIRYNEKEAFLLELANVYQNKFKEFMKEKEIIDNIFKLTDEELYEFTNNIVNMANNPNDKPDNPYKPLPYISAQTFSKQNSNKLNSYLKALNNIPSLNIYKFLKSSETNEMSFQDLFMVVIPTQYSVYGGNN